MSNRRAFRKLLIASTLAVIPSFTSSAQSTTWLNVGTDFNLGTNWSNGVPSSTVAAVFPAAASVQIPSIFADSSALGISFDNTGGGAYSDFTSNGAILDIYGGGVTVTGPNSRFGTVVRLQANQTFDVAANATLTMGSGINMNSLQLTKAGSGTLVLQGNVLDPASTSPILLTGGTMRYESTNALGAAVHGSHSMQMSAGTTLELKPGGEDLTWGVAFDTTPSIATGGITTMSNGTTIRALDGDNGTEAVLFGGGRSPRLVNGSTVTLDVPGANGAMVMQAFIGNQTETLSASGSKINVTGSGQLYLSGGSAGGNAYTGAWDIQMNIADFGLAILNSPAGFGQRTGGAPAQVTLSDGFTADMRSGGTSGNISNPLTMNGGVLAFSQAFEARANAGQLNGSMTINDLVTESSFIRLSEVFSGVLGAKNMNVNQAGVLGGSGVMQIFGNTTLGAAGIFKLANTSTITPNSFSGLLQVSPGAILDASTSATGSNPLGTGDVALTGGELLLNHPGTGTISTYATNAMLVTATDIDETAATLTIGSGSTTTGSTLQLGLIELDSSGAGGDVTLVVGNGTGTSNYSLELGNLNAGPSGNATITAGPNPADISVAGLLVGTATLNKTGNNTMTLNSVARTGTNSFAGGLVVGGGTLAFNATARLNGLTVNSGSLVKINAGGSKLVRVASLSLDGASNVDVGNNDLIVDNGDVNALRSSLASGVSGNGIKSSTNTASQAIGYATGAELGGTFRGEAIAAADVVLHPTFKGDANLDGATNTVDFNVLAGNFGGTGQTWTQGDFTYDGNIDSTDFTSLLAGYGNKETLAPYAGPLPGSLPGDSVLSVDLGRLVLQSPDAISGTTDLRDSGQMSMDGVAINGVGSVVPEPASLSLLAAGLALIHRRRRA